MDIPDGILADSLTHWSANRIESLDDSPQVTREDRREVHAVDIERFYRLNHDSAIREESPDSRD